MKRSWSMYLKTKIYDNPNANPDIVPPKRYRAKTIKCWKKAWSFFMVNKMTNWDKVKKRDNLNRCAELICLIGSMIKIEVARQGQPTSWATSKMHLLGV